MPALPVRAAQGATSLSVVGGESMFAIASKALADAWQWYRIAALNGSPGIAPDFIVASAGTLMIPAVNPNASNF